MSLRHGVPKNLPLVVCLHACHRSRVTNHQPPQLCRDSLAIRHSPVATSPVIPLECAVTSKHRVLPGFGRSCPSVTPLECAVTQIDAVTPLECAVTKKGGGEGVQPSRSSNFDFRVSNFVRARGVPDSTLVSRILVPAACGRGKRCSA